MDLQTLLQRPPQSPGLALNADRVQDDHSRDELNSNCGSDWLLDFALADVIQLRQQSGQRLRKNWRRP
jgi:hypothetical protein